MLTATIYMIEVNGAVDYTAWIYVLPVLADISLMNMWND